MGNLISNEGPSDEDKRSMRVSFFDQETIGDAWKASDADYYYTEVQKDGKLNLWIGSLNYIKNKE